MEAPYLPPEVLETIFKNVENPRDLVSCRAVASLWKEEATDVLENRGPDDLVKWYSLQLEQPPSQPILPQLLIPSYEKFYLACFPNGITELETSVNPLFTKSLRLTDNPFLKNPLAYPGTHYRKKFPVLNIFSMHGDSLTSLSFHFTGQRTCFPQLDDISRLLEKCPNLEALQIHVESNLQEMDHSLPDLPLPNLKKLKRLEGHWCPDIFHWLLRKYANRLTLINSYVEEPKALTTENYPFNEGEVQPFDKLEELKVTQLHHDFFIGTPITFNLKRLSLGFKGPICTSFTNIIGFITRFQDTLVQLSTDYLFPRLDHPAYHVEEMEGDYHGRFQKLTTFGMYSGGFGSCQAHQMNHMKRHFLSKFPNLKTLEIEIRMNTTVEEATSYTQAHDLWAFCSNLEVIYFVDSMSYQKYRPTYKFYRPTNPY